MMHWLTRLFSSPQPVVEAARPRDARKLSQLHGASFNRGWSETEFEQLLAERNTLTHRLRAGTETIGFIISRLAADEAEILSVAIDGGWRGRGLSRQLLQTHLGHLAGRGIRTIFLEVEENNLPAVRLYRGCGFEVVGRREQYYRDPSGQLLSALVMQRDLS
jgi:[ribosomal protein S18]-alanine N-acetyltransferase